MYYFYFGKYSLYPRQHTDILKISKEFKITNILWMIGIVPQTVTEYSLDDWNFPINNLLIDRNCPTDSHWISSGWLKLSHRQSLNILWKIEIVPQTVTEYRLDNWNCSIYSHGIFSGWLKLSHRQPQNIPWL